MTSTVIPDRLGLVKREHDLLGNLIEIYRYDFSCLEDTVNLMLYLQHQYGVVDDVFCYKIEAGCLRYTEEFDSIQEFRSKFTEEKYCHLGTVQMECRDRWISFRLEHDTRTIYLQNSEPSMGMKSHDPNKIEYYKDLTFGGVIKYDKNDGSLYSYSSRENRWKHDRSLNYFFHHHDDYDYEFIKDYTDPTEQEVKSPEAEQCATLDVTYSPD